MYMYVSVSLSHPLVVLVSLSHPPCSINHYFLSMRMKQSDWLIWLSQRAVFLHPSRYEMQPARCEMQPAHCEMQPNLCEKL